MNSATPNTGCLVEPSEERNEEVRAYLEKIKANQQQQQQLSELSQIQTNKSSFNTKSYILVIFCLTILLALIDQYYPDTLGLRGHLCDLNLDLDLNCQ